MNRNRRDSLVVLVLAWALVGGASAQPRPVTPPETAPPIDREADDAARRFFQESEQGQHAAEEVRRLEQQKLDAETNKIFQDAIDQINRDMSRQEAEKKRREAMDQVISSVFWIGAAVGLGIYLICRARKRPILEPLHGLSRQDGVDDAIVLDSKRDGPRHGKRTDQIGNQKQRGLYAQGPFLQRPKSSRADDAGHD